MALCVSGDCCSLWLLQSMRSGLKQNSIHENTMNECGFQGYSFNEVVKYMPGGSSKIGHTWTWHTCTHLTHETHIQTCGCINSIRESSYVHIYVCVLSPALRLLFVIQVLKYCLREMIEYSCTTYLTRDPTSRWLEPRYSICPEQLSRPCRV